MCLCLLPPKLPLRLSRVSLIQIILLPWRSLQLSML